MDGKPPLEEVLRRLEPAISYHARRLERSSREIGMDYDDLRQEARTAITRYYADYDPSLGKVKTFFCPRIYNAMIDARRVLSFAKRTDTKRSIERGTEVIRIEQYPLHTVDYVPFAGTITDHRPSEELTDGEEAELIAMVRRRGARVDRKEARLLRWYFARGLTHREIAERLCRAESLVSMRLTELIGRLRQEVKPYEPN